jgi:hypothetical protein
VKFGGGKEEDWATTLPDERDVSALRDRFINHIGGYNLRLSPHRLTRRQTSAQQQRSNSLTPYSSGGNRR